MVLLFGAKTWVVLAAIFNISGDGDEGAKDRGRDLDKGGARQGSSGNMNQAAKGIYQQKASNGSVVGGPSANI